MSFEVYREPLYRRYYAQYNSFACAYAVVYGFLLVFLPLIIAYNTSSFWLKENDVYEQPEVSYSYNAMFQFHGTSYFWSTSPAINNLFSSTLKSSHISSIEVDMNRDQKTDRLELSIVVPLDIGENIYAFSSLFFFDVGLHDKAKYKFDSMVYVTHNSPYSMECVSIDGNLELSQSWALASKGTYRTPYAGEELLRVTKMTTAQDLSFASLLRKNSDRNLSLSFTPFHTYASPLLDDSIATNLSPRSFNATIIMRIPYQEITYIPSVSEVLKVAWIQYISFFIVVAFALFRINSFIFRHQLLYAHCVADIVVKKSD